MFFAESDRGRADEAPESFSRQILSARAQLPRATDRGGGESRIPGSASTQSPPDSNEVQRVKSWEGCGLVNEGLKSWNNN